MPCCSICKKEDDNPVDYGDFMNKSGICVHYYCLLLSTHLPQNGSDSSGILGFLLRDIRNEIKKCAQRICCYCKEPNASLACFTCKHYFHNICANQNNCSSEFIDDFRSYCHYHVPFKNDKMLKQKKSTCWICEEDLGEYNPILTLRSYCCQNGYVHRHCLRKHALNAGYRLICIWCTGKDFRDDMRKHGVFVPDREAIWDNNETQRYTDLHRGYSKCDAKRCVCPQGRDYFTATLWKLMICCMCGASGVHEKCGSALISKNQYTCETCSQVLLQAKRDKERPKDTNFNCTMFMSKTFEERPDLLQIVNCLSSIETKNSDIEEVLSSKGTEESEQINLPSTSLVSQKKPQIREMFMFGKNKQIVGVVKVDKEKLEETADGLTCKEEDVLDYSTSSKLLKSIFSDIEDEGRELSIDMVDEIFDRFKLTLENFGDDSTSEFSLN
ncbi:PHD finger protein 7-like [Episyrphus balteatus]|uniref:PHD finger protein 7-like n=1 Tax=Episyrphus balteatus TaxID=286459 RepID=UPI002484F64E|nr:PHD finger protein 7-like [Episyrphus balteatus]